MTADEQLAAWVAGDSRCPNDHDECCPDFSCCKPELQADEDVRRAFVGADRETRCSMLGMFLGAAMNLAAEGKKVHIVGDVPEGEVH